ncbi:hypothetical protein K3495_g861 [Podosphaera aphanis]|nr:hypothetical protein K3495_g861 [Podosphaera aphanis]
MDRIIDRNRELRHCKSPNYFSLAVRVYYSVIFHVQILHAKQHAGTLSTIDLDWLIQFESRYRRCPIAGPLVPIFASLFASMSDQRFYPVFPETPTESTYAILHSSNASVTDRELLVRSSHHLFPSVPLVASLLRAFCTIDRLKDGHFDDMGNFVPFKLEDGSGTNSFAGFHFPPHTPGTENASIAALLNNPAISHPVCESRDTLEQIHHFWRNSTASEIPLISETESFSPSRISEQLLLAENFRWFEDCVNMAYGQAQFFAGSKYLSQITPDGESIPIIISTLKFDGYSTLPRVIDHWYPDTFSSLEAQFVAYCTELPPELQHTAIYSLINSVLKWKDSDGHEIGSIDAQNRGGPYFTNREVIHALRHYVTCLDQIGLRLQSEFVDPYGCQKLI